MTAFLANHFRYDTMNSWNRATSYAHNVKVHKLGFSNIENNNLYELMDSEGFYDEINDLIHDFDRTHNWAYQAGFNGRSGGYLVLYQGGRRESGYKSWCTKCGQPNYQVATEEHKTCGRCNQDSRVNYTKPHMQTYSQPGLGMDEDREFDPEEWTMEMLRDRVELVQEFDQLAEEIRELARAMAQDCESVEEDIIVHKTVKVIKHKEAEHACGH